jgi:ATP-dependent Lon protease
MATALASALTQRPIRADTAMTGEISLRGRVLPIGGLREKVLAAHREGISRVLIPTENIRQLQDIPTNIQKGLDIIGVSTIDDVLKNALVES